MWNTPFQFALNKSIALQRSTLHRLEPLCCYTMRSAAIAGRALRIFTVCPQQRITLGVCNTLIILALGVWTAYVSEPDSKTSPTVNADPNDRPCNDHAKTATDDHNATSVNVKSWGVGPSRCIQDFQLALVEEARQRHSLGFIISL